MIIWDIKEKKIYKIIEFSSYSTAIGFSPSGSLAVGTMSGEISIVAVESGTVISTWNSRPPQWERIFEVWSLSFSPDGGRLATAGPIIIWDVESKTIVKTQLRPGGVSDLEFSPDGMILASSHWNDTARLWNTRGKDQVRSLEDRIQQNVRGPIGNESIELMMPMTSAAFSPDGKYLATAGADKFIRIWQVESGSLIRRLEGYEQSITALAWCPDGKRLASASLDGTVKLWLMDFTDLIETYTIFIS